MIFALYRHNLVEGISNIVKIKWQIASPKKSMQKILQSHHLPEAYLEPGRTFTMELFGQNSYRLAVN